MVENPMQWQESVSFLDTKGFCLVGNEALEMAANLLRDGKILAVKGIGGFHLAVNALDERAVVNLRRRKLRYKKPFAVMMKDIKEVKKYCKVVKEEKSLMERENTPILLLLKREKGLNLAASITPGLNTIGVMLPYTALHQALIQKVGFPLVMTSGNLRDEPLCKDYREAEERLGKIADGFLIHHRNIEHRIDDSVGYLIEDKCILVRRSRGFSDKPFILRESSDSILAVGAMYKNTFCVTKNDFAFLSHHIGDLNNPATYKYYTAEIKRYKQTLKIEPLYVVQDLHPNYLSSIYAKEQGLPILKVQHHHAHIASVIVEYNIKEKVLGVVFDGTGLGSDGNIWGGEFMLADLAEFKRVGHLKYVSLPGGDTAIKYPYRTAIGYIYPKISYFSKFTFRIGEEKVDFLCKQIKSGVNISRVSSMGRLFDAVASIIDLRDTANYQGQAAMELESIITRNSGFYPYQIYEVDSRFQIDVGATLEAIYSDYVKGVCKGEIATKFHNTIIEFTTKLLKILREKHSINRVVLSGGCFQNRYLLKGINDKLLSLDFEVFIPRSVPVNDGGISLGQAAIAQIWVLNQKGV